MNYINLINATISRLTISTCMRITDNMKLIDVNGFEHEITRHHINMMMAVGWASFFLAWILNIVYYALHPSAVDFNLSRLRKKLTVGVIGAYDWKLEEDSSDESVNDNKNLY